VLEPFSGGSAAYVARVRQRDGSEAVMKLAIPGLYCLSLGDTGLGSPFLATAQMLA
jgi:hypothetical protein